MNNLSVKKEGELSAAQMAEANELMREAAFLINKGTAYMMDGFRKLHQARCIMGVELFKFAVKTKAVGWTYEYIQRYIEIALANPNITADQMSTVMVETNLICLQPAEREVFRNNTVEINQNDAIKVLNLVKNNPEYRAALSDKEQAVALLTTLKQEVEELKVQKVQYQKQASAVKIKERDDAVKAALAQQAGDFAAYQQSLIDKEAQARNSAKVIGNDHTRLLQEMQALKKENQRLQTNYLRDCGKGNGEEAATQAKNTKADLVRLQNEQIVRERNSAAAIKQAEQASAEKIARLESELAAKLANLERDALAKLELQNQLLNQSINDSDEGRLEIVRAFFKLNTGYKFEQTVTSISITI